jgi:hypothetical protein
LRVLNAHRRKDGVVLIGVLQRHTRARSILYFVDRASWIILVQ